jgi:hypothetical protein
MELAQNKRGVADEKFDYGKIDGDMANFLRENE